MTKEDLKNKKSAVTVCVCFLVLIPALDQLTKYLVRTLMQVGDSVKVLGEFFRLTYVLNDGMAFGLGGGWRWVFMTITPIALAVIVFVFFRFFKKLSSLTLVSLVMIFAGGLSNMIDRVFFYHLDPTSSGLFDGRVVDFLDFNITLFGKRIWNAVFNVADAFVVVGVFLLVFALLRSDRLERKEKKTPSDESASAERTETAQSGTEPAEAAGTAGAEKESGEAEEAGEQTAPDACEERQED